MAKGKLITNESGTQTLFLFHCPGCGYGHNPIVKGEGAWEWNGSMDAPTIAPSILVFGHDKERRCHTFVREGRIEFLSDCFHELAGQTVELPEWEESA